MNYILSGLLSAGLVVHLIGWRLSRRPHARRNQIFGIRTRSSLGSDASWRVAQRVGWRVRAVLIPFYAAALAVMVLAPGGNATSDVVFPLFIVVGAASVLVSTISTVAADHAAKAAS